MHAVSAPGFRRRRCNPGVRGGVDGADRERAHGTGRDGRVAGEPGRRASDRGAPCLSAPLSSSCGVSSPTMTSYQQAIAAFRWHDALADLGWLDQSTVDLAWTIVDRHARSARADQAAILWVSAEGAERRITFRELSWQSMRVGNLLRRIGVRKGDRVATVLPRIPETLPVILGALRVGAIFVPIFSGFGEDAVAYRLDHSGAKAVCVSGRYRHVVPTRDGMSVISIGDPRDGDIDYASASRGESDVCEPERYARDEPA